MKSVLSYFVHKIHLTAIDTFLSHSNEDKKIARRLADILAIYGFDVFVAHDDIEIGDEWEETLKEKIKNCELVLALLSKNFHEARFTDHEIGIATAFNKQVFPIRIDAHGRRLSSLHLHRNRAEPALAGTRSAVEDS